jgi:DNA repair protein RecO (recombination protein O)
VVPSFFLKVLALEGFRPLVEECVECGAQEPLVAFDLDAGGTLCDGCRRGHAISPEALALLQQVLGGQLGAALNQPVSPATHEVSHLATTSLEHHLERRLRSVTLLDQA